MNRLGARRVMEERPACSSKFVNTCLEGCCGAELPWRLAPCSDAIRVPRLTVDYSGPMASPAVDVLEISHTAFMLCASERSLECVLAIRGDKFLDVMLAWCIAIWAQWMDTFGLLQFVWQLILSGDRIRAAKIVSWPSYRLHCEFSLENHAGISGDVFS